MRKQKGCELCLQREAFRWDAEGARGRLDDERVLFCCFCFVFVVCVYFVVVVSVCLCVCLFFFFGGGVGVQPTVG